MTDEQPTTPASMKIRVGTGKTSRVTEVSADQVFIYAPGVLDTNDPATQSVMQRAADLVRREIQRAERRSVNPGDWMRSKRDRTQPTPEETLVVISTEDSL